MYYIPSFLNLVINRLTHFWNQWYRQFQIEETASNEKRNDFYDGHLPCILFLYITVGFCIYNFT
jgi:hypothetical protein